MSKFLLTVCALGLLSSSAFAQEKSPEQMLEKQQLARVVTSGTSGDVNVRVTKQPEHGAVETTAATDFPTFPKENMRARCNNRKVRGVQVNYKSAEKYVGADTLHLLVLFPGGFGQEVHLNINVR